VWAAVIGTVRRTTDIAKVGRGRTSVAALTNPMLRLRVCALAPNGVDRTVEISFSDNADFDTAVVANQAIIAGMRAVPTAPVIPFYSPRRQRLHGSEDCSTWAQLQAGFIDGSGGPRHHSSASPFADVGEPQSRVDNARFPSAIRCGPAWSARGYLVGCVGVAQNGDEAVAPG
jgi:hypothetical protein